jgi:hypothetical protein
VQSDEVGLRFPHLGYSCKRLNGSRRAVSGVDLSMRQAHRLLGSDETHEDETIFWMACAEASFVVNASLVRRLNCRSATGLLSSHTNG